MLIVDERVEFLQRKNVINKSGMVFIVLWYLYSKKIILNKVSLECPECIKPKPGVWEENNKESISIDRIGGKLTCLYTSKSLKG